MRDMGRVFTTAPMTRLRVAASPNAEVVAALPIGTEVELCQEGERYVQVSAWHPDQGRITGWVYKPFVGLAVDMSEGAASQIVQPPCSACGALDWFLVDSVASDQRIPIGSFEGIYVKARVCRACGLYQRCLDQKGMDRLEEWLSKKTWCKGGGSLKEISL